MPKLKREVRKVQRQEYQPRTKNAKTDGTGLKNPQAGIPIPQTNLAKRMGKV